MESGNSRKLLLCLINHHRRLPELWMICIIRDLFASDVSISLQHVQTVQRKEHVCASHLILIPLPGLNPYPWIRWWYALAAPRIPPDTMELPLTEREFLRRGKLTSIALLIELIELLLTFGPATQDGTKTSAPIILVSIGVIIVAVFLNRTRKRLLAGLLVLMIMEGGMVSLVAAPPSGQMGVI